MAEPPTHIPTYGKFRHGPYLFFGFLKLTVVKQVSYQSTGILTLVRLYTDVIDDK
ncbi:Hypothetical predicted protein [Mytilus galloprovincialis]|uniref:Uncharacterized protein n=1 Tax=Mytilus galloprovincialis TaxID=29158 RepID=A0A8B6C056_MYTGA|nr:Hypothetical predicted protein [Mytilus galloprovincialis]